MNKAQQVFEKFASKKSGTSALKDTITGTAAGIGSASLLHSLGLIGDIKQQNSQLHTIKDTVKWMKTDALKNTKLSPKLMSIIDKLPNAKAFETAAKYTKRFNAGLGTKSLKLGLGYGIYSGLNSLLKNGE